VNYLRLKEIYTLKRVPLPIINPVVPGEEIQVKIVLFCTREEINEISKKAVAIVDV